MGTPWPTLSYQWYVCNSAAATATPVDSCATAPQTNLATLLPIDQVGNTVDVYGGTGSCVGHIVFMGAYEAGNTYESCSVAASTSGLNYIAVRPNWPGNEVTPNPENGFYWVPFNLSSGTATRAGNIAVDPRDLGNYGFAYVVPTEAAGKFLTFTATLSNEATTAQGTLFTITQSRIQNSGIIQTTPGFNGTLAITGTLRAGFTLTATGITATTNNSNPTGKISYQWQRCTSTAAETCSNISGATRSTYKIVKATDQNKYLRVVATARNNATTPDSTTATNVTSGVIAS
jgi:hypothetical protein